MRSRLIAVVLGGVLSLVLAGAALAISISPATQTHNHGVASNWTANFQVGFREIKFCYGEGSLCVESFDVYLQDHKDYHHTFWPCSTTTYTQSFSGYTDFGTYFPVHSTAKEYGGTPC